VPERQHRQQFLVQQFEEGEPRWPRHGHTQQGHMDVAPHHRLGQVGGGVLVQVEFHLRVILAKRVDDPGHQRMQCRRRGEADGQFSELPACGLARPCRGAADRAQYRIGFVQQRLAGDRQLHAAGAANEQRDAEFGLQRADLLAERRLLHVEPPRRTGDVPLLGDGDEVAEMTQFHARAILGKYGISRF